MFNNLLKTRKGQSRILEAVIGAVIIFIVFSVATFLIRASDVKVLQERGDLDRLGYNVLNRIVESGTIESLVEVPRWDIVLRTAVQKSLPSTIYFNLTVFNCINNPIDNLLIKLDYVTSVSNASPEAFTKSKEVSSTTMIYTSKNGNVYYLVLVLARAGEAE